MVKRMKLRMKMMVKIGIIWANRLKRKKMMTSLVESGEIVAEASKLDVLVNRKRAVGTRKYLSFFPKYD